MADGEQVTVTSSMSMAGIGRWIATLLVGGGVGAGIVGAASTPVPQVPQPVLQAAAQTAPPAPAPLSRAEIEQIAAGAESRATDTCRKELAAALAQFGQRLQQIDDSVQHLQTEVTSMHEDLAVFKAQTGRGRR